MRKNKSEKLVAYLQQKGVNEYVGAEELTLFLGISRRQLQKYIATLNKTYSVPCIFSSSFGYSLNSEVISELQSPEIAIPKIPEERRRYILQKLLSSPNGYNSFDLAEELFVSIPTIEADLKDIRSKLKKEDIQIKRNGETLFLEGDEQNKRRLMIQQINHSGFNGLIFNEATNFFDLQYSIPDLNKKVGIILKEHDFYMNDYALNNLILHLIIMTERIYQNCEIEEIVNLENMKKTPAFRAGVSIVKYMENEFDIRISDAELHDLVVLLMNCSSSVRYNELKNGNASLYIENQYIEVTQRILVQVSKAYFLDFFNKDFAQTFALHIKNLVIRASKNYHITNPLSENIKTNYPLIYDIAVFISHCLQEEFSVVIDEDEITYIAFHIGSYFENNVRNYTKVKCVFIYSDYNGFFEKQIRQILKTFENQLMIEDILSVQEISFIPQSTDMLITMVDIDSTIPKVLLPPFLIERDFRILRKEIEKISAQKKANQFETYLSQFFHQENFYSNLPHQSKKELLNFLCDDALTKNLANTNFKVDVFKREELSPTAFNCVAVPHTLSEDSLESFFSFGICESPVLWTEDTQISLVVLIGINEDSREIFSQVFDYLISILSDNLNVKKLIQCENYDEFFKVLLSCGPV